MKSRKFICVAVLTLFATVPTALASNNGMSTECTAMTITTARHASTPAKPSRMRFRSPCRVIPSSSPPRPITRVLSSPSLEDYRFRCEDNDC